MTWVDAIVVLILSCSALIAFLRGFIREALGVFAWIGAGYVALTMFSAAQPEVRRYISNPDIADPVAGILIFIVALIAFSIIASLFARMVRLSSLGGLDRTIGLLFGVLRGALLVSGAYLLVDWKMWAPGMWPEPILESRSLPYVYQGAQWIAGELPDGYAPKVDPPPPIDTPSAALLQTPPHGFALDGRVPPHTVDSPDANGTISSDPNAAGGQGGH